MYSRMFSIDFEHINFVISNLVRMIYPQSEQHFKNGTKRFL